MMTEDYLVSADGINWEEFEANSHFDAASQYAYDNIDSEIGKIITLEVYRTYYNMENDMEKITLSCVQSTAWRPY